MALRTNAEKHTLSESGPSQAHTHAHGVRARAYTHTVTVTLTHMYTHGKLGSAHNNIHPFAPFKRASGALDRPIEQRSHLATIVLDSLHLAVCSRSLGV